MASQKGDIVSADRHYFNRCVDIDEKTGKKTFETYSLWNRAKDCELDNGENVQEKLDSMSEDVKDIDDKFKETLIYNPDTDSYQGYVNGEWKDVVYAGLKNDGYIIKDGAINYDSNFGGGLIRTNFTRSVITLAENTNKKQPPAITPNFFNNDSYKLKFTIITNTRGTVFTQFPIDFTKYNKLILTYCPEFNIGSTGIYFYLTDVFGDLYDWAQGEDKDEVYYDSYKITSCTSPSNNEDVTINLDLSKISFVKSKNRTGKFYLAIYFQNTTKDYGTTSSAAKFYIKNMQLK